MSTSIFSITLQGISKRYGYQWIFEDLSVSFLQGKSYAIRGFNGSGKSTLLRILSSMESPSTGKRLYQFDSQPISVHSVPKILSFSAPYMNIPDHHTVREAISFHGKFKSMTLSTDELLGEINMDEHADKSIHVLSSGQRQKIKLALAMYNNDILLLLDEPGTNLDENNYQWFANTFDQVKKSKLACIATNEERDAKLCDTAIWLAS